MFALNQDGSAHDQSHGTRIPKYVAEQFGIDFPKYNLPPRLKIASRIDDDRYYNALRYAMRTDGDIETDQVYLLDLDETTSSEAQSISEQSRESEGLDQ